LSRHVISTGIDADIWHLVRFVKMGHGIWAVATEEEIRRREQMAAEFLALGL
jgi:hypothetical protein